MQRVQSATAVLESAPAGITEWEEALIRQLVDTVKVVSAEQIVVCFRGGRQTEQSIVY
jgi:site-specific DNA recombinase